MFVQTRELEFAVSVAPAGIVPTAPPPDDDGFLPAFGLVVTVFPLGVVVAAGCAGAGVALGADLGVDFGVAPARPAVLLPERPSTGAAK